MTLFIILGVLAFCLGMKVGDTEGPDVRSELDYYLDRGE